MYYFKITRGDTKKLYGRIRRGRSIEVLSGSSILFFTMKKNKEDPDNMAVVTKDSLNNGIVIYDAALGKYTISLDYEDTDSLETRIYYFDVQYRDDQDNVYTIAKGEIEIEYDITRRNI